MKHTYDPPIDTGEGRPNPYEEDGKWWFYDETEEAHGPYETEEYAKRQLDAYVKLLSDGGLS